ncbi:paraquat-inducible protein A [Brevirhabdus sp.]|uniref:paraquat-inducible protein A n=1 Tax=Brevirhabdus sp. TaxID=2004514 RepID=UPI004058982B
MTDIDDLIACPQCDALYRVVEPAPGERASCARCHTVLIAPRRGSLYQTVALSVTVMILMMGAIFFPFLQIRVAGFYNTASVFDAALTFSKGYMLPLSFAVAALIVVIPISRVLLLLYVLAPITRGAKPLPGAAEAFRLSEALRPWSMAEIFVLGVAVALIKVADLARVGFGPAFWMFAVLVIILLWQDSSFSRWTVWKLIGKEKST